MGSAETGTGLVRALAACKRYGVDLINLSYGEPFYESTSGRVAETFDDAVRKWSMTVFTSAGNDQCINQIVAACLAENYRVYRLTV